LSRFAALRVRNFRLYFIGQFVSNSGNWLTTVAITLLVLHRTGSGVDVGWLSACQYGPLLVLSPWTGLVADRSDKRRLLFVTQGLELAQSITLAVMAFTPGTPLAAFFLVAAAGGCMLAFDNPGRRSFVSEMVAPELVPNAVALYNGNVSLSRLVGPTLAAGLVVAVGFGWCFTIDAVSYAAVIVALVMMRNSELRDTPRTPRGRGQIRDGLHYVASIRELWVPFVMLLIVGAFSFNFTVVFPIYVERGLGGTDTQFALFFAVFSAGSVIGTLLVAHRTTVTLRTLVGCAALFGASMVVLGVLPNLDLAFPMAAVVGGTSVAYLTTTTSISQLRSDPQMVGRVLALQTALLVGTTPLGGPVLGALADAAGGRVPVWVGGIAALLAALLGLMLGRRAGPTAVEPERVTVAAASLDPAPPL
jgi:MFS family permease